jgi:hypothetical protein
MGGVLVMTIVRCPRCKDEVTVPSKATGRALVRCPLCLEEYLLAEALANSPPPLVIIGGEVERGAIADLESGIDDYRVAGGFSPDAFDSSAPAADSSVATAPALRGPTRPRRKEPSSLIFMVNVVGGGIVAMPLALLALWWAFRVDPLDLGPQIAQYAPWIVPQQFRGKPSLGSSDSPSPKAVAPSATATSPAADSSSTADATETPAAPPSDAAHSKKNRSQKKPATTEPKEAAELQTLPSLDEPGKLPGTRLEPVIDTPVLKDRGAAKPRANQKSAEPARTAAASVDLPDAKTLRIQLPPAAIRSPGVVGGLAKSPSLDRPPMPDLTDLLPDGFPSIVTPPAADRPQPTPTQFADAVDGAAATLSKYDGLPKGDGDGRRAAFTDLHAAACELGRVVSHVSIADADLSESVAKMQTLLDSLAGKSGASKISAIKFLTAQRWSAQKNDQGLIAAGIVKDFKSAGPLFEVALDASVRDTSLTIPLVTANNPQDLAKIGDEIVALGRVIDQPKTNLPGYEGDQPRVLLLGFAMRADKAE